MAKLEEKNVLDYRMGGDTVDDFAQKYMAEMNRIYQFLNNLREHNSYGTEQVEPTSYQVKVEDDKIYIRNLANDAWIFLMDVEKNGGFKSDTFGKLTYGAAGDRPTTGIAQYDTYWSDDGRVYMYLNDTWSLLLSLNVSDLQGYDTLVTNSDVIAPVDTTTVYDTPQKLVKLNDNGVLPVNISGNAGKIAGIKNEVNNLQDGQVLTYRSVSNSWRNEDKGVVGAGKTLTINDGETLVATYSGDAPVAVDLGKTAMQEEIEKGNRKEDTVYEAEDIAYHPTLPTGWYLECSTGGTTANGDLTITSPTLNDTIIDGTVVWIIRKISSADGVPLGTILPLAHNSTLPAGYLLCDGSAVSRTMYPDLFAAIGTTYGAGDGSTTFNLPDYNAAERFVQGSSTAGTVKQAGLPNITGEINSSINSAYGAINSPDFDSSSGAFSNSVKSSGKGSSVNQTNNTFNLIFDASLSNSIYGASTTVQPPALTARYIIKAFDGQTASSALIDITQYANGLAGKADRQLSNLDTANLSCHLVVDSYYDSTTGDWYRVYDDGWVEQGQITSINANSTKAITLLKPLSNTNYTIAAAIDQPGGGQTSYNVAMSVGLNKTTTGFSIGNDNSSFLMTASWVAFGMGATS